MATWNYFGDTQADAATGAKKYYAGANALGSANWVDQAAWDTKYAGGQRAAATGGYERAAQTYGTSNYNTRIKQGYSDQAARENTAIQYGNQLNTWLKSGAVNQQQANQLWYDYTQAAAGWGQPAGAMSAATPAAPPAPQPTTVQPPAAPAASNYIQSPTYANPRTQAYFDDQLKLAQQYGPAQANKLASEATAQMMQQYPDVYGGPVTQPSAYVAPRQVSAPVAQSGGYSTQKANDYYAQQFQANAAQYGSTQAAAIAKAATDAMVQQFPSVYGTATEPPAPASGWGASMPGAVVYDQGGQTSGVPAPVPTVKDVYVPTVQQVYVPTVKDLYATNQQPTIGAMSGFTQTTYDPAAAISASLASPVQVSPDQLSTQAQQAIAAGAMAQPIPTPGPSRLTSEGSANISSGSQIAAGADPAAAAPDTSAPQKIGADTVKETAFQPGQSYTYGGAAGSAAGDGMPVIGSGAVASSATAGYNANPGAVIGTGTAGGTGQAGGSATAGPGFTQSGGTAGTLNTAGAMANTATAQPTAGLGQPVPPQVIPNSPPPVQPAPIPDATSPYHPAPVAPYQPSSYQAPTMTGQGINAPAFIDQYAALQNPYDAQYQNRLAGQAMDAAEQQYRGAAERIGRQTAQRGLMQAGASGIPQGMLRDLAMQTASARTQGYNDAMLKTADARAGYDLQRAGGQMSAQAQAYDQAARSAMLPYQVQSAAQANRGAMLQNDQAAAVMPAAIQQAVSQGLVSQIEAQAAQRLLDQGVTQDAWPDWLKNVARVALVGGGAAAGFFTGGGPLGAWYGAGAGGTAAGMIK